VFDIVLSSRKKVATDDNGLRIHGIGSIPWDCIHGVHFHTNGSLFVKVTNIPKLERLLGKNIFKRLRRDENGETGIEIWPDYRESVKRDRHARNHKCDNLRMEILMRAKGVRSPVKLEDHNHTNIEEGSESDHDIRTEEKVKDRRRNFLLILLASFAIPFSAAPPIGGWVSGGIVGLAIGLVHTIITCTLYYGVYKRRIGYLTYITIYVIIFFGTILVLATLFPIEY